MSITTDTSRKEMFNCNFKRKKKLDNLIKVVVPTITIRLPDLIQTKEEEDDDYDDD